MSREKQISYIARRLWGSGFSTVEKCEKAATDLVDHGYRKQSEGEWLDTDICAEDMHCSVCGGIAPVDCEKEAFYKSNFCPNCGAKMKGGAE